MKITYTNLVFTNLNSNGTFPSNSQFDINVDLSNVPLFFKPKSATLFVRVNSISSANAENVQLKSAFLNNKISSGKRVLNSIWHPDIKFDASLVIQKEIGTMDSQSVVFQIYNGTGSS